MNDGITVNIRRADGATEEIAGLRIKSVPYYDLVFEEFKPIVLRRDDVIAVSACFDVISEIDEVQTGRIHEEWGFQVVATKTMRVSLLRLVKRGDDAWIFPVETVPVPAVPDGTPKAIRVL